jgi:hypothetical protein
LRPGPHSKDSLTRRIHALKKKKRLIGHPVHHISNNKIS